MGVQHDGVLYVRLWWVGDLGCVYVCLPCVFLSLFHVCLCHVVRLEGGVPACTPPPPHPSIHTHTHTHHDREKAALPAPPLTPVPATLTRHPPFPPLCPPPSRLRCPRTVSGS